MKKIYIFTDGSSLNNRKKGNRCGGVGVFFGNNDNRNISYSLKETPKFKVTNQVAELLACVMGIEKLISSQSVIAKQIIIYTDSMYIVKTISEWAKNWEKNNWKKANCDNVKNLNLIKKLYYYSLNLGIIYRHVKSHKMEPDKNSKQHLTWYGNNQADKLATDATKKIKYK